MADLWELRPRMRHYNWNRARDEFRLAEGDFPFWVALAAEEGSFWFGTPDEEGEAAFGDVVFCRPHTLLRRRVLERLTYHVIQWDWEGAGGGRADPGPDLLPSGKVTLRDVARLSSDFALLRGLEGADDPRSLRRRDLVLDDLLHLYYAQASGPDAPRPDGAMHTAARLLQARAFRAFSMREVSDAVGLSPVQFTRHFRAAFGTTPTDYVTAIRLRKARDLLLETDMTVQEVAAACGYASGLYLSRVFTRALKVSPGRFRRTHRL